ncbi:hypothetical protein DFH09DRAFT_1329220 [Mycena vulgaris]|nr:hypothetical protein DFH09DRAFT_1329220 [Mycena vulgaris]
MAYNSLHALRIKPTAHPVLVPVPPPGVPLSWFVFPLWLDSAATSLDIVRPSSKAAVFPPNTVLFICWSLMRAESLFIEFGFAMILRYTDVVTLSADAVFDDKLVETMYVLSLPFYAARFADLIKYPYVVRVSLGDFP